MSVTRLPRARPIPAVPRTWRAAVARVVNARARELGAQRVRSLVTAVHGENVKIGRGDELVLVGQEQRVDVVHQLRRGGHRHLVGMAIEDIESQSSGERIAHRDLLSEDVA